jgi:4,5:9,10-diseco-3-hydroxy-5,9,17-trioxoandrosta-1(10),2-diene-4-oate hydrolase
MSKRHATGVPEDSLLIDVDGVSLAVAREGCGVPVICLHAIAHGGGDFAAIAARMTSQYEVIRVDWPGHGRSGEDHQPLGAVRYAQLLTGLTAKLGIERPILIGCSIGGAAAILYAQARPVRGLVLCDSGGLLEVTATVRRFCAVFARFFAAGERRARWFGAAYGAYYRLIVLPSRAATDQRQRIVACGYEMAGKLREAFTGFGQASADIREAAWRLDVPVWFAWARSDRVIPLSFCKPTMAKMKRTTLTTFSGGHAAFLEQPDAFARGFVNFAETLGDDPQREPVTSILHPGARREKSS